MGWDGVVRGRQMGRTDILDQLRQDNGKEVNTYKTVCKRKQTITDKYTDRQDSDRV